MRLWRNVVPELTMGRRKSTQKKIKKKRPEVRSTCRVSVLLATVKGDERVFKVQRVPEASGESSDSVS